MRRPIKQRWKWTSIVGELYPFLPQFVKERMRTPHQGLQSLAGSIRQGFGDEIHGLVGCFVSKDLFPLATLDLRELEFDVIRVHASNFLLGRGAQYLDDFHQLIDTRITRKQRLAQQKLRSDTPLRPDVNGGGVVGATENKFGCTVVPTANITYVWFSLNQCFGRPEIAQLQLLVLWIDEEILRFDIPVTNSERMNVC